MLQRRYFRNMPKHLMQLPCFYHPLVKSPPTTTTAGKTQLKPVLIASFYSFQALCLHQALNSQIRIHSTMFIFALLHSTG